MLKYDLIVKCVTLVLLTAAVAVTAVVAPAAVIPVAWVAGLTALSVSITL
jgi:hypothetical protein